MIRARRTEASSGSGRSEGDRSGLYQYYDYRTSAFDVYISSGKLTDADITEKAKQAGAKGFKLVGCTCVGQDLQLRGAHYEDVFDGHAGNNYTSEAILATGAIDAVISEFNCTLPGIEPICDELKIKQFVLTEWRKKQMQTGRI